MRDMTISERAIAFIIKVEGLSHGEWPGGASGVTIGRGYDLGYHTTEEFVADWGRYLPQRIMERLRRTIGVKGEAAKALSESLRDIRIPQEVADRVFREVDVPRWIIRTAGVFPGYDYLPDDAQGALVSLVFNRGTAMGVNGKDSWDARREMRVIRDVLASFRDSGGPAGLLPGVLRLIAAAIRSMTRLWRGKNLGGLIVRREREAALVESSVPALEVKRG